VTIDYTDVFTDGAQFDVAIGRASRTVIGPVTTRTIGAVTVSSGSLTTFDPADYTYIDQTVLPLDRTVPAGEHATLVALDDDDVLALLIRFADTPAQTWTQAYVHVPDKPDVRGAYSKTRFSFGLGDAAEIDRNIESMMVAPTLDEVNKMRAIFGAPPVSEIPASATATPRGAHPTIDALRTELVERTQRVAVAGGIVAVKHDAPATCFWGLAGDVVVSLVCDLGKLRDARRV
jgi:hypothetical protein